MNIVATIRHEKDESLFTEETIRDVYEFDFDFKTNSLIFKHLNFGSEPSVKVVSFKNIKDLFQIKGTIKCQ